MMDLVVTRYYSKKFKELKSKRNLRLISKEVYLKKLKELRSDLYQDTKFDVDKIVLDIDI